MVAKSSSSATVSGSAILVAIPTSSARRSRSAIEPYTIVGVVGRSFQTDPESDLFLPFQFDPNSNNQGHFFSWPAAQARRHPGPGQRPDESSPPISSAATIPHARPQRGFGVQPLRDSIVSGVRSSLFVLIGAVELRAAHRLRQRRQPSARPRHRTQARIRHSCRDGSRPRAHHPPTAH